MKAKHIVELRKGKLLYYYVIRSTNGQVVVTSEKYFSRSNAIRAVNRVAKAFGIDREL